MLNSKLKLNNTFQN